MTIGVFDSGVGGLWILRHLKESYPEMDYVFVADGANVPYGVKSIEEVRKLSEKIVLFLKSKGVSLIVIACNTASGAALNYLRQKFPEIIFVGMEPAIKPATTGSETHKVGVLATRTTFSGELYTSLKEKFSDQSEIFEDPCLGLVTNIENNKLDSPETELILKKALLPMLEKGADTIVLGCTHYPFVIPTIRKIVGEKIKIIDPTGAIVKRVGELAWEKVGSGQMEIFTTGNKDSLKPFLEKGLKIDKIIL